MAKTEQEEVTVGKEGDPENVGIVLKCPRKDGTCGHVWRYKGKQKFYTRCPNCKTSVRVDQLKPRWKHR